MWLILTRRPGETIKIGTDIEVCILRVNAEGVDIGITAPRDVLMPARPPQPPRARFRPRLALGRPFADTIPR